MKALILAAGEGLRMGPLTENQPKPMLPVGGRPFLEHTLDALRDSGVKDILILTGYRGSLIKEHFGNGEAFGVNISYLVQPERLGTAHAVGMARGSTDGPFLCLNGDVIVTREHVEGILSEYGSTGRAIMSLVEVGDAGRFGLVGVDDGKVVDITEKSGKEETGLINGGIYLFDTTIFDAIERTPLSSRKEYEITQSIKILMEEEDVGYVVPGGKWVDIGSPWDLLGAHEIHMEGLEGDIEGDLEENVHIRGNLVLKKGAVIRSGTYIEGNVIADAGAVIGPNSYIRGSTYIGKGSRVGAASEVKNSIIFDRTNIPHHNYVGDSIIGCDCNLGSGTKVANLRIDDGPVKVVIRGTRYNTGRRKLGVIMGDDVKTGINATIDPGTIIFGGSRIGPGARVSGTITSGSRVH